QTRGWFYSLLAISTLLFNKAPYRNVVVLGLVQDENGQKMSKSKGNAVDPFEALAAHGADAIRWYFYSNSAPWLPSRFHDKAVKEGQRKFMGTLWNTYAFFVLYANIDDFDATQYKLEYDKLSVMDRWLLSKMNSLILEVDNHLGHYRIPEAARALQDFVDDMSNWYVRRSRERFWVKGMPQDKINAYMTLYTALVTVAKLAAPMIPFMTESIYRNLVCGLDHSAPESVHLCGYPKADEQMIDKKLEEDMDTVLKVVVLGRAARNGAAMKNRQPLAKMYVKAEDEVGEYYKEIIEDELNIKSVEFTNDVSNFTSYSFKPQLKTLGPKYGKQLGEIRTALSNLDGSAAKKQLDSTGVLKLALSSGEIELAPEDLLIEMTRSEKYYSVEDGGITVAIDTELTDALVEEGFVREIISKLQTMRKEADFNVMDHIYVYVKGSEKIASIMQRNLPVIENDTLADALNLDKLDGYTKEWDINGETATLGVKRVDD
ncbi:MAG TPA: isoleucine--tRNA ligase, partial [Ruminococcaceae bacterium]|nr:isoleucine--tRNA ligase [Oscillospiraceae bacterium]